MAGRKQHFIPRRFVRNFSDNPETKNPKIWFYRFDKEPYSVGINDAPAQRHFYSNSSDYETLDDEITKYEEKFVTPILMKLETSSPNQPIESDFPAKLISHLVTRNDHIRSYISMIIEIGVLLLKNTFYDKKTLKKAMGIDPINLCGRFNTELIERIKNEFPHADDQQVELVRKFLLANLTDKQVDDTLDSQIESFKILFLTMKESIVNLVKQIANAYLKSDIESTSSLTDLKSFHWSLIESKNDIILPDCISICKANSEYHSLMGTSLENTDTIYCPITRTKLLIGTLEQKPAIPDNINVLLAENSWNFFIAPTESANYRNLTNVIRKNPLEEIDSIVETFKDKILHGIFF